jgi:hypothetical protein
VVTTLSFVSSYLKATDMPERKSHRRSPPSPSQRLCRTECYETLLKKRSPEWNLIRIRIHIRGPGAAAICW